MLWIAYLVSAPWCLVAASDVKCGWRFVQKGQEVDNLIKKLSCRWAGQVGGAWSETQLACGSCMCHVPNWVPLAPPTLPPSRGYREKGLYKSLIKHKDHIQEPSGDHAIDQLTGEGGRGSGKALGPREIDSLAMAKPRLEWHWSQTAIRTVSERSLHLKRVLLLLCLPRGHTERSAPSQPA